MSRTNRPGQYLQPIKSDGTPAVAAGRMGFYTLAVATYYVEVNMQSASVGSLHLQWNTALIGTITLESTDSEPVDAPLTYSTADATWIQHSTPTVTGDVPITGTGATEANLTITLAGGGAGGAVLNLSDVAPCRLRLKLVITTGGTFRVAHSGKA